MTDLSTRAAAHLPAVSVKRADSGRWSVIVAFPAGGGSATWCETHAAALAAAQGMVAAWRERSCLTQPASA